MTSPKELEGADDNLIDELMTMFADGYVDKLTYRAAKEIVRLEEALASITRERDAMREGREPALEWGWFEDAVTTAWNRLCEVDDRTSPEEYPDMLLITRDELERAMEEACDAIIPASHSQSRASSLSAALVNGEGA